MKGKKAAQSANRRATQASATVDELRAELAKEREGRSRERAELKRDISRLQGQLISEVARLADERVAKAREWARQEIAEATVRRHDANLAVARYLKEHESTLKLSDWMDLYELLDLHPGESFVELGIPTNRNTRQSSVRKIRHIEALREQGRMA